MSNEVIARPAAFQAMQTDIQVSMEDVVSAFVSQYENNLFKRKAELSKQIRALKDDLDKLHDSVLEKINADEWSKEKLPFGLGYKIGKGSVEWNYKRVQFAIEIKEKDGSRWSNTITIKKNKTIPQQYLKKNKKLNEEVNRLNGELSEVLVSLKGIDRKERQVRGRIAIRKLEDSGYADLMKDDELLKLVQLEE